MIENDKVGDLFYKYRHSWAPTQRDVGDCSPLKDRLPEGAAPLGENFSELLVKINGLFMKIIFILWYLPVYFWSNLNDDHEKYVFFQKY